jgi:hypothetical protein
MNKVTKRLIAEKKQKEIAARRSKSKPSKAVEDTNTESNPPKVTSFSDFQIVESPIYLDTMIKAENISREKNLIIASISMEIVYKVKVN